MNTYITSTPGIIGGKPAIAGTRVPMSRILFLLKEGYNLEAIHEEYPNIPLKKLKGAIDQLGEMINNNIHVAQVL